MSHKHVVKPTFEEVANDIRTQINRRRQRWRATNVKPWEDVAQDIFIHVYNKWYLFDPNKKALSHWLNVVISNQIKNEMRNLIYKNARPCIGSNKDQHCCIYNGGGNLCTWPGNSTGIQCSVCPVYRAWQTRKSHLNNINTPLSLDNHAVEADRMQCDFTDIDGKKKVLDDRILSHLSNETERKMYTLMFIEHKTEEEVGYIFGYKLQDNSKTPGYQMILKFRKKVIALAREIVYDEDLF